METLCVFWICPSEAPGSLLCARLYAILCFMVSRFKTSCGVSQRVPSPQVSVTLSGACHVRQPGTSQPILARIQGSQKIHGPFRRTGAAFLTVKCRVSSSHVPGVVCWRCQSNGVQNIFFFGGGCVEGGFLGAGLVGDCFLNCACLAKAMLPTAPCTSTSWTRALRSQSGLHICAIVRTP